MAKNNVSDTGSKLRDFLIKMAHDQNLQRQFRDGGMEDMMTASGLSASEKSALRSGDAAKIRKIVGPPRGPAPIVCNAVYQGNQPLAIEL